VNIVSVATIVSVAWERLYDLQPWTNLTLNKKECLTFYIVSKVLGQIVRERKSEGPERVLKFLSGIELDRGTKNFNWLH